jgi:hypothetical protein
MTDYTLKAESGEFKLTGGDVKLGVTRGPENWQYIYTFLGFFLAVGTGVIDFLDLSPAESLTAFGVLVIGSWLLFIRSGRFQAWLLNRKTAYENKPR